MPFQHGKHARKSKFGLAMIGATGAMALSPIIVQPGDTLSGIADKHDVPVSKVIAANPQIQNPNLIYAGQKIYLTGSNAVEHPPTGGGGGGPTGSSQGGNHSSGGHSSGGSSGSSSQGGGGGGGGGSSSRAAGNTSSADLADVPGVPRDFAKCVAFRESSNNPSSINSVPGFEGMGGGAYGIMDYVWQGSDLNKSGQPYDAPLSEQKEAFSKLYAKYGSQPWTPSDGCQD